MDLQTKYETLLRFVQTIADDLPAELENRPTTSGYPEQALLVLKSISDGEYTECKLCGRFFTGFHQC